MFSLSFPYTWKWSINMYMKKAPTTLCAPYRIAMLCINFLIEVLYPFHLHRGTVCLRVCLCLATDQKYSWEHVERQDCTEHAQMLSTGRWAQCYRYLHPFLWCLLSVFCPFSLTSFIMQIEHFAGNPPPPKDKHNLIPSSVVHLHIFRRTASASCILSLLL